MDGLRDDPAIFNHKRVSAVAHTRMLGLGRPLQKGEAPNEAICVHVWCLSAILFEQTDQLLCACAAAEYTSTLEDDDFRRRIACEVLFESMLASQAR